MKCYSFSKGRLVPGLVVQQDEALGSIVFLGESGRGRRYEKVGLFRKSPAEVVDGKVLEAHPVKITARNTTNEKSFVVLAKPQGDKDKDQRVLVRVNTCTGYIRGGQGFWKPLQGKPEALVEAYGAYGAAGRIGTWGDDIVLLSPGDVLVVRGSRSGRWVIDYSDPSAGPAALVRQDWDAKQARENAGDIEWL